MLRNTLLAKFALFLLLAVSAATAQDATTNYGGIQQYKLSPGQNPAYTLFFMSGSSGDPLDMPEPPANVHELVNLTPGHSYKLSITKVGGYSGFAVSDLVSTNGSPLLNVTNFSEVITPTSSTYGPVQVWLAAGATSVIGYATTDYQITLMDANTPAVTIGPVGGIHDGMLIKSSDTSDLTVYLIE